MGRGEGEKDAQKVVRDNIAPELLVPHRGNAIHSDAHRRHPLLL